ncbi:hypothetical protein PV10_08864 [Exophiala mesophila]|uniref:Zn(2)-C6 fungal-type domain-containing protein n=1 Tax=Exophiala mesophila TaxID=212818 RepID=A0A0D1XMB0_EXOME|nr:uncharacterized protein PV10_08864 [Exophiala mesophila]KIV89286.1 hypothetical protein PV10_08864 [Exophiala mesophila]
MSTKSGKETAFKSMNSKPRSRPPSLLACIPCRKSHVKCDGQKPLCSRCQSRKSSCFWVDSNRGYRHHRKPAPLGNSSIRSQERANTNTTATAPAETTSVKPPFPGPNVDVFEQEQYDLHEAVQARQLTYEEIFQHDSNDLFLASLSLDPQQFDIPAIADQQEPNQPPMTNAPWTSTVAQPNIDNLLDSNSENDLVGLFYRYFHRAHPFLAPWQLYKQDPSVLPAPLLAVVLYVASHYTSAADTAALDATAKSILNPDVSEDGFKVQGLALYALVKYARAEQETGSIALDMAVELALRLGMNRESYAIVNGQTHPIMHETWRRTWWSLFAIEGITTAIGGQPHPFRTYSVASDVALPGPDDDYDNLIYPPIGPIYTLSNMQERMFMDLGVHFSSFAYVVEAAHNLGAVLALPRNSDSYIHNSTINNSRTETETSIDAQVEAIDAKLASFQLSLPPDKRDPLHEDTTIDQTLLWAHLIINWAGILLHRPRSSLTFMRSHYRTICTRDDGGRDAVGIPVLEYTSHTAKALRAAHAVVNLASLQPCMASCTPTLMCGLTAAATVHLPAYAIVHCPDQAVAIKERLQLGIAALASFGDFWPRATIARSQIARFAHDILTKPTLFVDSTGPGPMPMVSVEAVQPMGCDASFDNDQWMENLIQAELAGIYDDDGSDDGLDENSYLYVNTA